MAAICPDFKWLGFRISDAIQNPDRLQPNLSLTIGNPDKSGFQIPTICPIIECPYLVFFFRHSRCNHCSSCRFGRWSHCSRHSWERSILSIFILSWSLLSIPNGSDSEHWGSWKVNALWIKFAKSVKGLLGPWLFMSVRSAVSYTSFGSQSPLVVSIDLFSPLNCSFSYNGVYQVIFKLSTSGIIVS